MSLKMKKMLKNFKLVSKKQRKSFSHFLTFCYSQILKINTFLCKINPFTIYYLS